jgi:hypothetical protein
MPSRGRQAFFRHDSLACDAELYKPNGARASPGAFALSNSGENGVAYVKNL